MYWISICLYLNTMCDFTFAQNLFNCSLLNMMRFSILLQILFLCSYEGIFAHQNVTKFRNLKFKLNNGELMPAIGRKLTINKLFY